MSAPPEPALSDQVIDRLASAIGAGTVAADPATLQSHAVDGIVPRVVCSPESAEQIASVLRICGEARAAVAPWGGGTMMSLGNIPRRLDVVIRTSSLGSLGEHDDANLTATMGAGITLDALQRRLAERGQFLPFDPPQPGRATVGGTVAAAVSGPRRMFYGGVRDLVIGMKMVLVTGEQIKAGGKVVKNVAGYDMCKLFTGSLGTLGIITEVTCKVMPLPERALTVAARGEQAATFRLVDALFASVLQPSAIAVLAPALVEGMGLGRGTAAAVAVEGFAEAVDRHVRDITEMARSAGLSVELLTGSGHEGLWAAIRDFPLAPAGSAAARLTVPAGAVAAAVEEIVRAEIADRYVAHAASGTVWVALDAARAPAAYAALTTVGAANRGHAVLSAAPPEAKRGLDVWGPPPTALSIMTEIKRRFDPLDVLNPGRFVALL